MDTRLPLRSLVQPELAEPNVVLREEKWDASFSVTSAPPAGYVWPDLHVEMPDEAASVLLVTAPAAMGKSAAAKAVAQQLRAPLIDLAKVPVGGDTLTGLLTRVLGWQQAFKFVERLHDGKAFLVLDSLDEARLGAGRTHFRAFLRNVAEFIMGAQGKRQVVIFGRWDAVEAAYSILTELGIKVELASVAPLTHPQSAELLDTTLDNFEVDGRPYAVHRTHSVPFGQYRDETLLDMAAALGARGAQVSDVWTEVGDFLGYPPVLLVLAQHLIVDNPASLKASRGRAGVLTKERARGELLREVVEGLLDRESAKVRKLIAPVLSWGEDDSRLGVIYTREEQVLRLVEQLGAPSMSVPLPATLTNSERATYEDQVGAFVADHPFIRGSRIENVVFGDYLQAFLVTSGTVKLQLAVAARSPLGRVGPFFYNFVQAMASTRSRGYAVVDECVLDDLIKSFAAGGIRGEPFALSVREIETVLILTDTGSKNKPEGVFLGFLVQDSSGVVVLSSPLARGMILAPALSITTTTDEVVLGPDLLCWLTSWK